MKKVSLIVKETIRIFVFFMFAFIWIRYFLRSFWKAALISAILACCALVFEIYFKHKTKLKATLKEKERRDAENMFLSLIYEQKPISFFSKLLSEKHQNIQTFQHYLKVENAVLWFEASFESLSIQKLVEIRKKVSKEKASKLIICCRDVVDKSVLQFTSNFSEDIVILNQYEMYEKIYKAYGIYPKVTQQFVSENKLTIKDFIAFSFNKKRTKGYLLSAFVLILSSLFVRQTLYYCLIASTLIVFAVISEFNPVYNKKKQENLL